MRNRLLGVGRLGGLAVVSGELLSAYQLGQCENRRSDVGFQGRWIRVRVL